MSPISVWEVATLVRKGRIGLSLELRAWVTRGLSAPGVHVSEFTPEIAIDSADLPVEACVAWREPAFRA